MSPGAGARLPSRIGGFRVVGLAGRGGMGLVFEVIDEATGARHALKVLGGERPPTSDADGVDPETISPAARRFVREAQALARVDAHPHVGRIHSSGALPDGRPFLVLEWLAGGSLDAVVERAPIPWREAATIVMKLAGAAGWVHARGLIHRDIKPANVLFDDRGEPRLTDFGLVRDTEPGAASRLTKTGALVGTPLYMAPEQLGSDRGAVGPATDVWALGALLQELLTGESPFVAHGIHEVLNAVLLRTPPAPSSRVAEVPGDLDRVVARALAKRAADRYATGTELADDLGRVLAGQRPRAGPVGRRHSRRLVVAASALAAVLVATGVTVLAIAARDTATDGTATAPEAPPEATPAEAIAAGDYVLLLDAATPLEASGGGRLARAVELLRDDGEASDAEPDVAAALAELERARSAGPAAGLLRAELLALLGRDADALAAIDATGDAAPALLAAQRARLAADRGRKAEAAAALAEADGLARVAGLGGSVARIAAGTDMARRWLAGYARRMAVLGGRTGLPAWTAVGDALADALAARAPGSGLAELARAEQAWEARDGRAAAEHAAAALALELDARARAAARHIRARALLAPEVEQPVGAEVASLAVEDARLAAAAIEEPIARADAVIVQLGAQLAAGQGAGVVGPARDLQSELTANGTDLRGLTRVWRAQVMEARGHAAAGDLARAIATAARAAKAVWEDFTVRARMTRLSDIDAAIRANPDDATALLLRGLARTLRTEQEERWRAGCADLARASRQMPQALVFRRAGKLIETMGLSVFATDDGPIERPPLSPVDARIAAALERLGRGDREPSSRTAERALAELDVALALHPTHAGAWTLRGECLFIAGRHPEADLALETATKLRPDVVDVELVRLRYDRRPERRRRAVERLARYGANSVMLGMVAESEREAIGEGALARRIAQLEEIVGLLQVDYDPTELQKDEVDKKLPGLRRIAGRDWGDDGLLWHLAGCAALRIGAAGAPQERAAAHARAAEAFRRAEELTNESRAGGEPLVHRGAIALALDAAGRRESRDPDGLLAALDRCLAGADAAMPVGGEPVPYFGFMIYVPQVMEVHHASLSRARLHAIRARARQATGDLDGARRDAERAATIDPRRARELAEIYRTLQGRR